jgi:2-dehydro-3-deoxygluconokinase
MENFSVVAFGEVMMRLGTINHQSFLQAREFDVAYTGAEANSAVSLARFGVKTYLVSCVPPTDVGDACINYFRQYGVDTSHVRRSGERMGLFYLETGANQRASKVIYDRNHSAITQLRCGDLPWNKILQGKDWLHLSGTAPALSENMAAVVKECCEMARAAGVTVSIDMNFREKLWRWRSGCCPRALAGEVMRGILPLVDVIIGNEEDAENILGIRAGESDVEAGTLEITKYADVARQMHQVFPQAKFVAITLRESLSASHNNWGAMLYDCAQEKSYLSPRNGGEYEPYPIRNIVDRVGGGDSFSAGLIYGLYSGMEPMEALDFATAASCLSHSYPGDFNLASKEDVLRVMQGKRSGRVQR